MDSRTAERAANQLHGVQQFFVHASLLAVASVVVTVILSVAVPTSLFPLSILTIGEGFVAMCAYYVGRDLVQRLALEPSTERIPAVRRYREHLLEQTKRDRLAASINSLIAESDLPAAFCLTERIVLFEDQLRVLACELATPTVPVQARSLVMCIRLLTRGVESPLFNPSVPVEHLQAALLRIRLGIGRPAAN
jgi:hypothetical protein